MSSKTDQNFINEFQEFFDTYAPEYMNEPFTQNTVAEVDFLLEELNIAPGCTILDIGCGTGRHDIALAPSVGLDHSTDAFKEVTPGKSVACESDTDPEAPVRRFYIERIPKDC